MSLDKKNMSKSNKASATKLGRPKKTSSEVQDIKDNIVKATRLVFGQYGSHGLTVERIIKQAKTSRPTFYKYFTNTNEALDIVISSANKTLIESIRQDAGKTTQLMPLILLIIDHYFKWGAKEVDIISSLHQELLSPDSIVAKHRKSTIDHLHNIVHQTLSKDKKNLPDRIIFETLIMAGENIGYHILNNPDPDSFMQYRSSLIKMAIALFGDTKDWETALDHHDLFK
jgi:AcrR family transcriptional regulator